MWIEPKFIKRRRNSLIHEDASQKIQGGLPGEHYHISAALYAALIDGINNPTYGEAVTSVSGEQVYAINGEIVISIIQTNPQSGTGASVLPAGSNSTTTSPPSTIVDIVSPPVPTAAPLGTLDPYWNFVTCLNNMTGTLLDEALGLGATVKQDQYNSRVTFSDRSPPYHFVSSSAVQLFGHNTIATTDVNHADTGVSPASLNWASAVSQEPHTSGSIYAFVSRYANNFCMEQYLGCQAKNTGGLTEGFKLSILENYGPRFRIEIDDEGNGKCGRQMRGGFPAVWQWLGPVGFTSVPEFTFQFPWNVNQMYLFTIERVAGVWHLYIDGTPIVYTTLPGTMGLNTYQNYGSVDAVLLTYAHIWGPVRLTGRARYFESFTMPTADFPRG